MCPRPGRLCNAVFVLAFLTAIGGLGASLDDVKLVNQEGKDVRFHSDLIKGKVVVLSAFFTSCESICPVVSGRLAQVQGWLGDRLGRDVFMVSVTLDPATDTAKKLKTYADKLGARPGWDFVTGDPEDLEVLLGQLGQTARREDHSGMLIVANEPKGLWRKISGMARAQDIEDLIDQVAAAR